MRHLLTLLLSVPLLFGVAFAQTTVTVTDQTLGGDQTYNWTADNEYILDGLVFLEAGSTLNIAAGTVIRGLKQPTTGDNTSALIIARGARIVAEGRADRPIIFTASDDDLSDQADFDSRDRGEWGGLILLGRAVIARPDGGSGFGEDGIEGLDSDEPRARFGGNDNADDSGVLRYVSIRHGGAQLSTDNEINGLTLGGVGSGTVIDYIEVFANEDDGIEWFGGTVNVGHATVAFCGDDAFDYDYGWRGKGQFWFAIQEPGTGTGRSGEHDGASPDNQQPFSRPTIYNATYVGIGTEATASGGDANRSLPLAVLFRDNAGGYYRNSLFTGFNGAAVAIEDRTPATDTTDSYTRFLKGDLDFTNNVFEGFGGGSNPEQLFLAVDQNEVPVPAATATFAAELATDNVIGASGIAGISRIPDGRLDPRISAGGLALGGGGALSAADAADGFLEAVAYRGAFGNRVNWLAGWTALATNGYLGDLVTPTDDSDCLTITDADLEGGNTYTWGGGNCYTLDGLVFLEADATLNIEAGTVIRGLSGDDVTTGDNTSALIVARGARIFARGTAAAPVIFTAADDDLDDPTDFTTADRGEWGGLILLGRAPIARPDGGNGFGEDGIEGIDSDEPRARFGGRDAADNSGELRYVSIRHGGAQLSTDNEINGLTLGGVGSGTVIDYVEVFANGDDGIEWFGGTVRVDHAAVAFCGDDAFDYDYGWRGGGQYWFALQGPGDGTGRSGEHDGASPDNQQPFSQPTIYNATYIGIGNGENATGGDANRSLPLAVLFRDNAGGYYRNSVFTDFNGAAIAIEDRTPATDTTDSYTRFLKGDLAFTDNIFFNFGAGDLPTDLFLAVDQNETIQPASTAIVAAQFVAAGNRIMNPDLNSDGSPRDADGGGLDPRPNNFGLASFGAPPAEAGFDTTDYFGAFVPADGPNNPSWLGGWTALSAYMIAGDVVNSLDPVADHGARLDAPAPNPAADRTRISFELPAAARVTLTVVDLLGRPLARRIGEYAAGRQSERIDVSHLPNGTYLIVLDTGGRRLLQKMVVRH